MAESTQNRLSPYLAAHWPSQVLAQIFALLLAVTSTVFAAISGPTLQVLISDSPPQDISIASWFGSLMGPWVVQLIGTESISSQELFHLLPRLIVGLALVRASFDAAQWFCWERLGEKISYSVRRDLAHAYLNLNPTARRSPELQSVESGLAANFSNDIRLVREYIVHFFGGLPREGLQSILLITLLLSLNPKLFGIFAIGFLPVIAVISEWGKKLRRRARTALKDFSSISEWVQQRFLGIETIKHYRSEEYEIVSMSKQMDKLTYRLLKAARVKARTSPVIEAFSVLAGGFVIYIALKEIYGNTVSSAIQIAFFTSFAILGQNLSKLGKYLNSNREGRAGSDRIFAALHLLRQHQMTSVMENFSTITAKQPYIEAQGLTASYPGRKEHALSQVSYVFRGGKIHCLCGPSGAGKSTLFQLLLGTLTPTQGRVILGLPGQSRPKKLISYLPQNAPLFPGTILENLYWPDESGHREKALRCLAEVELMELISELPEHENTLVGEGGRTLSGGQAQRLHLARISYHEAQVYLIDEGTSALDPELEKLVFAMLRRLADQGAVVIMIAHRLAATEIADEILVLKDGHLTATGPASELRAGILDLYQ